MKKNIFGWLLLAFCFCSCSDTAKAPTIIQEGDSYLSIRYFDDGAVYSRQRLVKDVNDSLVAHGEHIVYYPNGNILSRRYYHLGNLAGQVDLFYVNGKAKSSSLYDQEKELVGRALYDTNGNFLRFSKFPFRIIRERNTYSVGDSLRLIYEILGVPDLSSRLSIKIMKDSIQQAGTTISRFDTFNNTLYGYYYTIFQSPGSYIHVVDFQVALGGSRIYQRQILDTFDVVQQSRMP